ncbi:hypothetical protein AJ88_38100 [Mesorhizobium amorphae CCBAU 01583]|nr:hypothetical protein AJ88_38100 [Mesorhizobium amorphae CCBAU 01583]
MPLIDIKPSAISTQLVTHHPRCTGGKFMESELSVDYMPRSDKFEFFMSRNTAQTDPAISPLNRTPRFNFSFNG